MALNSGNIYSIPEHPAEELDEEQYCEIRLTAKESNVTTKKFSSTSLPEKPYNLPKNDLNRKDNSIPTLITTEVKDQHLISETGSKAFQKDPNRLSVSLIDFSSFALTADSKTVKTDKKNAFANIASSNIISQKNSKSYLDVQDCTSHSNQEPEYETLLSPNAISDANSDHCSNSDSFNYGCQNRHRKESENLVFIDLNDDEDSCQTTENLDEPTILRQRSRSMQWIQSTFQNVSSKYRNFLELRRPSDIAEERMGKSKEGLDMEESESEVTSDKQSSSFGPRRFSENVIGKQKRFPFASRLGHLKDLFRDRNLVSKRQEEKDIDQTRPDVCPLFTFPRKRDEDELILDALRQSMRKCTAVDPSSRPTSTIVLDQLSKLLDEC